MVWAPEPGSAVAVLKADGDPTGKLPIPVVSIHSINDPQVPVEQQAAYRETVLTAFQQVEDELAALRILADEYDKQRQTIASAGRALTISDAQYKAGTTSYLTVITSQATLLNAERVQVNLLTRRLTAAGTRRPWRRSRPVSGC